MAILFISEYAKKATDQRGHQVEAGEEPALTHQKVTFTTTTQSAAFNNDTAFIRAISDTDCYLLFGENPTAVTATNILLKANTVEFFGTNRAVVQGAGLKVAAVT